MVWEWKTAMTVHFLSPSLKICSEWTADPAWPGGRCISCGTVLNRNDGEVGWGAAGCGLLGPTELDPPPCDEGENWKKAKPVGRDQDDLIGQKMKG